MTEIFKSQCKREPTDGDFPAVGPVSCQPVDVVDPWAACSSSPETLTEATVEKTFPTDFVKIVYDVFDRMIFIATWTFVGYALFSSFWSLRWA